MVDVTGARPSPGPLAWVGGPMPPWSGRRWLLTTTLALLGTLGLVLALGTPSLRTSDDAEMMAAVSGYDGGARRPELLFTSVLVGRVLVALYDLVPAAPWYGLYLHGLQLVALVTIATGTGILLRGAPRGVVSAVMASLLLTAANAMMAVQFTIVGILLAVAGGVALLALRATDRGPLLAGAVAAVLLWAAFLVRVQAFALGALLVGLLVVVRMITDHRRDVAPVAALALVLGPLLVGAVVAEQRWWAEEVGAPRPSPQLSSGLSLPVGDEDTSGSQSGRFSANDRALIANWLIWPDRMFLYDAEEVAATTPVPATVVGPRGALLARVGVTVGGLVASLPRLPASVGRLLAEWWWALLLPAALVAATPGRRYRAGGAALLGGGTLLLAFTGISRLPDRVAVPAILGLVVVTAVTFGASGWAAGVQLSRTMRALAALPLAAVLLAIPPAAASIGALSQEAEWRRARAEAFLTELSALPDDVTVVLWLIDSWHAIDPLAWGQQDEYPVVAVQLAGWQYVLPYREEQRRDRGLTDWIGAVADRDDVLLVAEEERVELLRTLLRERRGRLCTDVDVIGTVRDGRELLVRRIDEVTCQGLLVSP